MARKKLNRMLVIAAATLLVVGTAIFFSESGNGISQGPAKNLGKFRLPMGHVTPAIGLGATHGVILAADGSLWAWGENADGWSVMGLSDLPSESVLATCAAASRARL